jgi:glycosyltransferase involved in cell wall biosynthesis
MYLRTATRQKNVYRSPAFSGSIGVGVPANYPQSGFNDRELVVAQAMLLRRPVIATDWSATSEFLDTRCGLPIGYRLVPAQDPRQVFEAPGAVWAEADVDQAAMSLRELADSPARRTALGGAAREAAQARLGGDGLLAALAAIGVRGLTGDARRGQDRAA